MSDHEDLWELIRSIPRGRVCTYGALGAALNHPATGFLVGRMMAHCPDGLPWWRVIAKSGNLPIGKMDPYSQMDQRRLLEKEGVEFIADQVDVERFIWYP